MKAKHTYPLFSSHLDLAHQYWEKALKNGGFAIDATCGNGHDTLFLKGVAEGVIGLDIQEMALEATRERVGDEVELFHMSHESFPKRAYEVPILVIAYNLGYLPGGDKSLTTKTASTLKSLYEALNLIQKGGIISITCYPGHEEGLYEEEALTTFCADLPPQNWAVCHHKWVNRKLSPSLLIIQKYL